MSRIVIHWTGGGALPSSLDLEHYHLLVGQDRKVRRGNHSIRANAAPINDGYAAHTRGCNTGSIGLAVCGMLDAREYPFHPGPHPILEAQCLAACHAAAQLCDRYGIPVTPQTVLQHGEVQSNLGIWQHQKWDCCVLPWAPHLSRRQAGDWWRNEVSRALHALRQPEPAASEPIQAVQAAVMGFPMSAYLQDGAAWVPVRRAAEALGFAILAYAPPSGSKLGTVVVGSAGTKPETGVSLSGELNGGTLYVKARSLATALNKQVSWDPSSRKVSIF